MSLLWLMLTHKLTLTLEMTLMQVFRIPPAAIRFEKVQRLKIRIRRTGKSTTT